ncbi:MAG: CvpA family protein [Chloroflexales bacterium]|nr:CvpA family protein [Chloroflexales bacterium]
MELVIAITLIILGIWGLRRGVERGLLTLIGTLLGALLVELWFEALIGQDRIGQQFRPETFDTPALLTVMAVFLAVAVIVGYGSGLLLRQSKRKSAPKLNVRNRIVGGLVGVLNGALIASYALHFAAELSLDFESSLDASLLLGVLYAWLPWYILAVVSVACVWITVKAAMRLVQLLARASAADQIQSEGGMSSPMTAAKAEQMQSVSDKINSRLGNTPRK